MTNSLKRLKLFWHLLTHQNAPDLMQNACRGNLRRAWQYSRLINGIQAMSLFECVMCDGTGKAYGDRCPRCYGSGVMGMPNPKLFLQGGGGDRHD
jgi:hypothetical protein